MVGAAAAGAPTRAVTAGVASGISELLWHIGPLIWSCLGIDGYGAQISHACPHAHLACSGTKRSASHDLGTWPSQKAPSHMTHVTSPLRALEILRRRRVDGG